jgi:hypothetical protein
MQHRLIQSIGIAWTILFSVFIVWIYATEPRNLKEVTAGVQAATVGYKPDQARFDRALDLFHHEQFSAAREEWGLADQGRSDPLTQFYIAYAFYREGWGPVHPDPDLYRQGLEAVNRALSLETDKTLTVDDPNLQMHTAVQLKAELEQGLKRGIGESLFNIFSVRK